MKGFKRILDEIKRNVSSIELLALLLNGIIIFLVCYILLYLINVKPLFALVPSIAYLISKGYLRLRKNKLIVVEKKYAEMDEKLRTAEDNLSRSNEMIEGLQEEIASDVRKVDAGSFFSKKREGSKIAGIILLCFLVIFISTLNFQFFDFSTTVAKGLSKAEEMFFEEEADRESGEIVMGGGPGESGDIETSDDIYGMESIAKLGEQKTEVQIKPVNYEISIKDTGKLEKKEFQELFPEEIYTVTAETYEENIPKEQEELVRNYFERLAEE